MERMGPKPEWLKARLPAGDAYFRLKRELRQRGLHTICESARCPNADECWNAGHATFLLLGPVCTRRCRFCSVDRGAPQPPDPGEAERILEMAGLMNLRYAVLTSVTRDDLEDQGSGHFARVVSVLRAGRPDMRVEVLIPDFSARGEWIDRVLGSAPDVVGHNIETVRGLYARVDRDPAAYDRSLSVLAQVSARGFVSKSGLMVGLGESGDQLAEVMGDLRRSGVRLLTIGQYLQPRPGLLQVQRYYAPAEFAELRRQALTLGFAAVESGPFVRSSYHAESLFRVVSA